jgi:murein DD-endopeptidase MepM/ murein hydrolase activator NlpD
MSGKFTGPTGLTARLKLVFRHVSQGFSFIIAPHGTGTTISFNLPGRAAILLTILVLLFLAGLVFLGITYGKLASLAVETSGLKAENEALRAENRKIHEMESEIARLDEIRREIETWAGILPKQMPAPEPATEPAAVTSVWPRPYSYAIMRPFYLTRATYPHGMVRPASGWVSRGFIDHEGGKTSHHGIDIAAAQGTPVRVALDGIVSSAGWDDIYGNLIVVEHSDSLTTVYGHNERIWVKEGDHVTKGQVIASIGNTGRSTAPHLHFEILVNNEPVDPVLYVDFEKDRESEKDAEKEDTETE